MIQFQPQETRFLQHLGRTEQGTELVACLRRLKSEMTSIASIDGSKDYGAQVEGRRLLGEMIDSITSEIETKKHRVKPVQPDDYT